MVSVAEEWRTVPGYENYAVSSTGKVLSRRRGRLLKPIHHHKGYLIVKLGRPENAFGIHRLVAWAFIGPQGEMTVNHIDGNKHNNSVQNLEYLTASDNVKHAYRTGLLSNTGVNNKNAKLTEDQVREIKRSSDANVDCAKRMGIGLYLVQRIRSGKNWKHVEATP